MSNAESVSSAEYIATIVAIANDSVNARTISRRLRIARLQIGSVLEDLEGLDPILEPPAQLREVSDSVLDDTYRLRSIMRDLTGS
jgi:hypothetical protein